MFAVVVTFQVDPDQMTGFLPLMTENARLSREVEPGCHQFDVWTDPDLPGQVFLYETYADREAFDAHLASDHFRKFDAATREMIRSKDVRTFAELET